MPEETRESKSNDTPLWAWPIVALLLAIVGIMYALSKLLEWTIAALLFTFKAAGVERLESRPSLVKSITVAALLIWTCASVTTCQRTLVRSPATVSVSGYTRADGTHVHSYSRRASGVAAADDRKNDETAWQRWLITAGWASGCGVIGLFFGSATGGWRFTPRAAPP